MVKIKTVADNPEMSHMLSHIFQNICITWFTGVVYIPYPLNILSFLPPYSGAKKCKFFFSSWQVFTWLLMVSGATADETGGENTQDIQRPGWVRNKKEEYAGIGQKIEILMLPLHGVNYGRGSLRAGEAFVAAWVFASVHIMTVYTTVTTLHATLVAIIHNMQGYFDNKEKPQDLS